MATSSHDVLTPKLKALIEDWRERADYGAESCNPEDEARVEVLYAVANELEAIIGERPPLHLTPRQPDKQPHSAITPKR